MCKWFKLIDQKKKDSRIVNPTNETQKYVISKIYFEKDPEALETVQEEVTDTTDTRS